MLRFRSVPGRFVLLLAIACATPVAIAHAADISGSAALSSRPGAAVDSLGPGITRLHDGAIAYRPAKLGPGAHPLVVLLHGNNRPPDELVQAFKSQADARGLILLAPKSSAGTWDLVADAARFHGGRPKGGDKPRFGPDVARIDAVLGETFAKANIDPAHVVLAGFSDGASYALSLGLANPGLFSAILALSPGLMVAPEAADAEQRLFIAHGRDDRMIAVAVSRDGLAPALSAAGMNVRLHLFNGGHEIDRRSLNDGLEFALDGRGEQRGPQ
ncbi:MAG: PHB depolymerase family esterase [Sphingomicrobium sp.]